MQYGLQAENLVVSALKNFFRIMPQTKTVDEHLKVDVLLDGVLDQPKDLKRFPVAVQITTVPQRWEKRCGTLTSMCRERWRQAVYIEINNTCFNESDAMAVANIVLRFTLELTNRVGRYALLSYKSPTEFVLNNLRYMVRNYLHWQPILDTEFTGHVVAWGEQGGVVEARIIGPEGQLDLVPFQMTRKNCEQQLCQWLDQYCRSFNSSKIPWGQQPRVIFESAPNSTGSKRKLAAKTRLAASGHTTTLLPTTTPTVCSTIIRRRLK